MLWSSRTRSHQFFSAKHALCSFSYISPFSVLSMDVYSVLSPFSHFTSSYFTFCSGVVQELFRQEEGLGLAWRSFVIWVGNTN